MVGSGGVEEEVFVDAAIQVADGFENGPLGGKGGSGVVGESWADGDQWGGVGELACGAGGIKAAAAAGVADGLPGWGESGIDDNGTLNFDEAAGDDFELLVRAFDLEIDVGITEVIGALGALDWLGADGHLMPGTLLEGQCTWLESRGVMAHGDGAIIGVGGAVDDAVTHGKWELAFGPAGGMGEEVLGDEIGEFFQPVAEIFTGGGDVPKDIVSSFGEGIEIERGEV